MAVMALKVSRILSMTKLAQWWIKGKGENRASDFQVWQPLILSVKLYVAKGTIFDYGVTMTILIYCI